MTRKMYSVVSVSFASVEGRRRVFQSGRNPVYEVHRGTAHSYPEKKTTSPQVTTNPAIWKIPHIMMSKHILCMTKD